MSTKIFLPFFFIIITIGCKNHNDNPQFVYDFEKGITIINKNTSYNYPIMNYNDFRALPVFYIDSARDILYFNNFNESFVAFDLNDMKERNRFALKKNNESHLSQNWNFKINTLENKNLILLSSNRNLWVFNSDISKLYANYIDSIQINFKCSNLGLWTYLTNEDSIFINLENDSTMYIQNKGKCKDSYSFKLTNDSLPFIK